VSLTWQHPEEIGWQLARKYPDIRPGEVAPADLPKWIAELPDFADAPAPGDDCILQVIHRCWCAEWQEVHGGALPG
jgi:FeS assembly protein IscX